MLPNCANPTFPRRCAPQTLVDHARAVTARVNAEVAALLIDGGFIIDVDDDLVAAQLFEGQMEPGVPEVKWTLLSHYLYQEVFSSYGADQCLREVLCGIRLPGVLANVLWPSGLRAPDADPEAYKGYARRFAELVDGGSSAWGALRRIDLDLQIVQARLAGESHEAERVARGVATPATFVRERSLGPRARRARQPQPDQKTSTPSQDGQGLAPV